MRRRASSCRGSTSRLSRWRVDSAKFDLSLSLGERARRTAHRWASAVRSSTPPTCLIGPTVEAWARGWSALLRAAAATPERADRAAGHAVGRASGGRILRGVERRRHGRCRPATLPELFAAQAARTPDAVAVVFGEEALTYGELECRANQLAHHLRALGVGPEVVVGLCVARSLEMVVGLLGILKAGGAYLPLDPDYPAERLAFMLDRRGRPGAGHPARRCSIGCRPMRRPHRAARRAMARRSRDRPASAPAISLAPQQQRLRHLHLGIDRHAQGRGGGAWRHPQPGGGADRALCHRGVDRECCSSPRPGFDAAVSELAATADRGAHAGADVCRGARRGRRWPKLMRRHRCDARDAAAGGACRTCPPWRCETLVVAGEACAADAGAALGGAGDG